LPEVEEADMTTGERKRVGGGGLRGLLFGMMMGVGCIAPPPLPDPNAPVVTKNENTPEVDAVIASLTSQRGRAGRPPPTIVHDLVKMAADDAVELEKGETQPKSAVQKLLRQAIWAFGNRSESLVVRGWLLTGPSLEQMDFPPEVIRASTLKCAIAVVHPPPKGGPYGVLFVVQIPGDMLHNQQFDL
jgi:hypothetical protein